MAFHVALNFPAFDIAAAVHIAFNAFSASHIIPTADAAGNIITTSHIVSAMNCTVDFSCTREILTAANTAVDISGAGDIAAALFDIAVDVVAFNIIMTNKEKKELLVFLNQELLSPMKPPELH